MSVNIPSNSRWIKHQEFEQNLVKLIRGLWKLLELDWEGVFERTEGFEAASNDRIWVLRERDPRRRRDPRHVAMTRSEIREGEIREGDGEVDEESFDVAWGKSGPALGTRYASAAQRRFENTERNSISKEFFFEKLW